MSQIPGGAINQTSLDNFYKVVQPKLPESQFRIWQILIKESRPLSLFEVAAMLHVPPHTISGRFTELKKMGLIWPLERKYDETRKTSYWLYVAIRKEI